MFDRELIIDILTQIEEAIDKVLYRFAPGLVRGGCIFLTGSLS